MVKDGGNPVGFLIFVTKFPFGTEKARRPRLGLRLDSTARIDVKAGSAAGTANPQRTGTERTAHTRTTWPRTRGQQMIGNGVWEIETVWSF